MTLTTPAPSTVNMEAPEPAFEIMEVTPELAQAWLEANTHNRPLSMLRVAAFTRDVENDAWHFTGEAIKFDVDGNVLDGQHRLWAVVEAQKPIVTLVISGLPSESQDYMDTGQKRTMGHVLGLKGIANPNVAAAVATLLYQWESSRFAEATSLSGRSITHTEALKVLDENPDIQDAVAFAAARNIPGLTLAIRAFVLLVLRRVDKDQADAFMADLSSMRTEGAGDPRSALLKRLANAKDANQRIDRYTQAIITIRTWNAVRRGDEQFRVPVTYQGRKVQAEDPI